MLRNFSASVSNKFPFVARLSLVLATVFGLAVASAGSVQAAACPSTNDAMTGGFSTKQDFIDQIQNGDSSGHHDLAALYSQFGFTSSDFSHFVDSAVEGTDFKTGQIMVDGQQVGTAGVSFGRTQGCQGNNPQPLTAGGTTFWGNVNSQSFADSSIRVWVMFDNQGVMQFAVMPSCGNPTTFTAVKPKFSCDLLVKHETGQANTFTFTTNATAENNATIAKVVYNFGDGSAEVTEPNGTTPTPPHTFTQSATVTTTVFVNLPGHQQVPVTSPTCQLPITVTPPPTPPPPAPTPTPPAPTPITPAVAPKVLPSTGAGDVIGLFAVVAVGGFLTYRWLLLRKLRANVDNR